MSKSDQNAVKQQANNQINKNNQNETQVNGQLQSILGTAQNNAASVLPTATSTYSDIASTGGFSPDAYSSITGTYQNLMSNGGISDADATAIKNEAAGAARSSYSTASSEAARQSAITGGYGGTSGAIQASLARQGSAAASSAANTADANIATIRQQGKEAGAAGYTNLENSVASNRLTAASGASNLYGLNLNEVNSTVSSILQNFQQTGQLNNQDMSILTNLANQPGVFDKIVGTIGTLGGAAAGIIKAVAPAGLASGG